MAVKTAEADDRGAAVGEALDPLSPFGGVLNQDIKSRNTHVSCRPQAIQTTFLLVIA
ncbi:hypothetical protein ACQQ2Q_02140 [Agrobacterium sp. ES01]|uniref:hypothetical protein n=1 Tax=Agrobacterium sp. ES01 TaxID=3420714 RepID=UPI003D0CF3B8